jgi:hypothetical protein
MIQQVSGVKLYFSSFYRVLKNLTKKHMTRNFEIRRVETVEQLNEQLSRFEIMFCCSQDLDQWVVDETSFEGVPDESH